MTYSTLKKELESALLITEWSPTESELHEIARRLQSFRGVPTKLAIEKIVVDVVGSYESIQLSGIDNSDLTTLLLIATKATPKP